MTILFLLLLLSLFFTYYFIILFLYIYFYYLLLLLYPVFLNLHSICARQSVFLTNFLHSILFASHNQHHFPTTSYQVFLICFRYFDQPVCFPRFLILLVTQHAQCPFYIPSRVWVSPRLLLSFPSILLLSFPSITPFLLGSACLISQYDQQLQQQHNLYILPAHYIHLLSSTGVLWLCPSIPR